MEEKCKGLLDDAVEVYEQRIHEDARLRAQSTRATFEKLFPDYDLDCVIFLFDSVDLGEGLVLNWRAGKDEESYFHMPRELNYPTMVWSGADIHNIADLGRVVSHRRARAEFNKEREARCAAEKKRKAARNWLQKLLNL